MKKTQKLTVYQTMVCRHIVGIFAVVLTLLLITIVSCQVPYEMDTTRVHENHNEETDVNDPQNTRDIPVTHRNNVYVDVALDPIEAEGLHEVYRSAWPFDIQAMMRDRIIVDTSESIVNISYSTGENALISITNSNKQNSGGAAIPYEALLFHAKMVKAQSKSRYSASHSRYGQMTVRIVTSRQRVIILSPGELAKYFSEQFIKDVETKEAHELISTYGILVGLGVDSGLLIDMSVVSDIHTTGTASSYEDSFGLGVSIISENLAGVNFNGSSGSTSELRSVSENSSIDITVLGGSYRNVIPNFETAVSVIPAIAGTLNDSTAAIIGLPSYRYSVFLSALVKELNPAKARQISDLVARRVGDKARELDKMFPGLWVETIEYTSAGSNMVALTISPHSLIQVEQGGSSAGEEGMYEVEQFVGWVRTYHAKNWGRAGQPGNATALLIRADPDSEQEEVIIRISTILGGPGWKGGNRSGSNKSGIGHPGGSSQPSLTRIERMDGTYAELTTLESVGGGAGPWNTVPGHLETHSEFTGILEYRSSTGIGTQGGLIEGRIVGANSSGMQGTTRITVIRL
ncbi:MAG: hypothetical protein FWG89_06085 [Treponema sp.]|nr:hypothetical protein [Treponema sp.]